MSLLDAAWQSLGEDAAALALVRENGTAVPLAGVLPTGRFVHDAIAAASFSASLLAARRVGCAVPAVELSPLKVATAVTSDQHFRHDGEPVTAWSELSGFWPCSDGWVRTHANYPHHRAALLTGLGLPADTGADGFMLALHTMDAADVEEMVTAAGGVATVVRAPEEWAEHTQGRAVAELPVIEFTSLGDTAPSDLGETTIDAPLAGLRVLDLTRVIAGPVAARTLGLWGADVLRIDSPRHPEIDWQHRDTGAGKRSALLDLDDDADRATFEKLLETADVVLTAYRPGTLDKFGISPAALAERRPGIIVGRLSAWGTVGPWAERRGFDSIVQAATGIAFTEGEGKGSPGALPAQALDHAAGYLLAAAVTTAVRRRIDAGHSWLVEVSLARVATELLQQRRPRHAPRAAAGFTPTVATNDGVTSAVPAPAYAGSPGRFSAPAVAWGSSDAAWRS
ncbi:CoA transferase [Salinibacterium sp. SWN1162]|uniref:CoA transferase n=1 Tax=Salinibacterium sp. SWN1162 TaxID=2792053 RepID=UPI0018CE0D7C|nr:CoA transferase [Salinibacterium sp. SWN1162]MBH0009187.1 CoA transferase [Salinibacterium sp. SWN1162]